LSEADHPAKILFSEQHPLTAKLGMKFFPVGDDSLRVELNAPEGFADRGSKFLHTGFNTLLLDTVLGSCAIGKLKKMQPIATIKLTCNHLRKLKAGEPLYCLATWYGEENSISYVNGDIRKKSDDKIISSAIGSFMVGTTARPLAEKQ